MKETIRIFAPATVANVGPGFDVLGFALSEPGDEVRIRKNKIGYLRIVSIEGDGGVLSLNPEQNSVSVPMLKFLSDQQLDSGYDVELVKKMPLGSGLGSSSASAVAGVFALNHLLGEPVSVRALLPYAMEGERVACGAAHADNVAPCLLGGMVLIPTYSPLQVRKIPVPEGLRAVVVHPDIEVKTKDARAVLPMEIPLSVATAQAGRLAGMISALYDQDFEGIRLCLKDAIAEPARAGLIPGFYAVQQAALQAGALGCSLSGSGPSVFALCDPGTDAEAVGKEMQKAFRMAGCRSQMYQAPILPKGPQVLD
jgi:homoserine kinase